jgi:hypothetical protein
MIHTLSNADSRFVLSLKERRNKNVSEVWTYEKTGGHKIKKEAVHLKNEITKDSTEVV